MYQAYTGTYLPPSDCEKAKLEIQEGASSGELELQFNPTSLKISRSVNIEQGCEMGMSFAGLKFKKVDADKLSFSFLIDESTTTESVLPTLEKYYKMTVPEAIDDVTRVPVVMFSWQELVFQGMVKSIDFEITLFDGDGVPKRAKIDLKLEGRAFDSTSTAADIYAGTKIA